MSNSETFEKLMRLAEFSSREVDSRRIYEWRVNFGLWTALAALAGFLLGGQANENFGNIPRVLVTCAVFFIFVIYVFPWQDGLHARYKRDAKNINFLLEQAEAFLEFEKLSPRREWVDEMRPKWEFLQREEVDLFADWSRGPQIFITLILVCIAIASIWMA